MDYFWKHANSFQAGFPSRPNFIRVYSVLGPDSCHNPLTSATSNMSASTTASTTTSKSRCGKKTSPRTSLFYKEFALTSATKKNTASKSKLTSLFSWKNSEFYKEFQNPTQFTNGEPSILLRLNIDIHGVGLYLTTGMKLARNFSIKNIKIFYNIRGNNGEILRQLHSIREHVSQELGQEMIPIHDFAKQSELDQAAEQ